MSQHNISENLVVVGTVDPDAYGTGTQTTTVVDMMHFDRVLFTVMAGTLGSSGTLDFAVYGDTANGGSFATAITGKAITQLTQAGTDSDKQATVEVTQADCVAQGVRYLRGTLTVGTAGSDAAVLVQGELKHYAPNRSVDASTVDEIV